MTKKIDSDSKQITNTPYDDVFRTLAVDCSQLLIPIVNELFHKNYTGNEKIVFGQNEHFINQQDGNEQKRITDSIFTIFGEIIEKYIFECQALPDNSLLIRVFEYITQEALDTGEIIGNKLKVKIPQAGILFLRSNKNTPDQLMIEMETPGGNVSFEIPVMKVKNYTTDEIFEKKLYFLIPFVIFNYENTFRTCEKDEAALEQLKSEYADLMEKLETAFENNLISAYYWRVIMDMSKKVLENIARKYDNVREGLEAVMGGHVLEHEGKKIYNEGMEAGMEEGIKSEKSRIVINLYRLGISVEYIAEAAEISIEDVEEIISESEKEFEPA